MGCDFWELDDGCKFLKFRNEIARWWQLVHIFFFTPKIEEDSHSDEHIFQMGWFNHQLE